MRNLTAPTAIILTLLTSSQSFAQQADTDPTLGLSAATTPPTPDCQSTANEPVLLVRNLIEGSTVSAIYAKPFSDYSASTNSFMSVGSFVGGQVNLLGSRALKGKKPDAVLGGDDDNPGRCGYPINFGQWGYRKTCSADKVENLYQMTVHIEHGGRKYTITMAKNVCDETMLDILPGTPSDDSDKLPAGQGVSGSTTPDCDTTAGEPKLLLRNLIEGTSITSVRVRPVSDYDRKAKKFITTPKGVNITSKPILGKPLVSTVGSATGRCGIPINFGKFDFRTDCSNNKMENLYEMTLAMQQGDKKFGVTLTKNVCDETMLDIVPGIPAEPVK